MTIQKQEFYEGAALHQLIRGTNRPFEIVYSSPFFMIHNGPVIYLKYSTAKRSPWPFTFTTTESRSITLFAEEREVAIGLICGSDGVVALSITDYLEITPRPHELLNSGLSLRITCRRSHRSHYEVSGPASTLKRKIPLSDWTTLLDEKDIPK